MNQKKDGSFNVKKSFEPNFEAKSIKIYEGNKKWDLENQDQLLKILTYNVAGRPFDLLTNSTTKESGECCGWELQLFNAQEKRIRAFFEWFDRLPSESKPQVLCFQEVMLRKSIEIAQKELAKRGFETVKEIDFDLGNDPTRGWLPISIPKTGSGLGVYVSTKEGLIPIKGKRHIFNEKLGSDKLSDKSYKWLLVESKNEKLGKGYFVIINLHTQAYQPLNHKPKEGMLGKESSIISLARSWAIREIESFGGYPFSTANIHQSQFKQIKNTIDKEIMPLSSLSLPQTYQPFLGIYVAGDFNVNMYATTPDSEQESDPITAITEKPSNEYVNTLNILNAWHPPLKREPDEKLAAPFWGMVTWNAFTNIMARQLQGPGALQWLDYVMMIKPPSTSTSTKNYHMPTYMDNRSIQVKSPILFPEIAPIWTDYCFQARSGILKKYGHTGPRIEYKLLNTEAKNNLDLGRKQQEALKKEFLAKYGASNDSNLWKEFVLQSDEIKSSQIWKGLSHYGLKNDDLDIQNIRQYLQTNLKVGDPHPFRMLEDLSDHNAVLARINLKKIY